MKKFLLPVLSLLAVLSTTTNARAEYLTCGLKYNVKGGGFQIGLGYFKLEGPGEIVCEGVHGEKTRRPAHITIGGHPIAPRFAAGYLHLHGASASVGFNGSIDDFFGHYLIASAQAAFAVGAGTSISVENPKSGLRLSIGVDGSYGLGAEAGFSVLTVEPIEGWEQTVSVQ